MTARTPATPRHRSHGLYRRLMLALAACGGVLPWTHNLAYFLGGGSVAPQVFWRDATANALTTAITLDVYLAALSFSAWVLWERRARWPGLYVAACFAIGLAFALPLYLALRTPEASDADPEIKR